MSYDELRDVFGALKICEVCGVSRHTESLWASGRNIISTKYWYMMKIRWPQLDLNRALMTHAEKVNRFRVKKGQPGLLD